MTIEILTATDADVLRLTASEAVTVMTEAVRLHGSGALSSPVRSDLPAAGGRFIITAGRVADGPAGFRVASTFTGVSGEATLVFRPDGAPVGLIFGRELGRRRTGALGGVAAALCSRTDSRTIGLVGAGPQAFSQLWAIAAVRKLDTVRVHSRSANTSAALAARARAELGLAVQVVQNPRDAVTSADIVVLATPAEAPLIDASWLAPGTHVHTLGPKGVLEGECPHELVALADCLLSDSPDQLTAMEGPGGPWTGGRAAVSLGEVITGTATARRHRDDITLYASVGLAGTEVMLADHLLGRLSAGRAECSDFAIAGTDLHR